ncbi:MAG: SRPBCC family protein [Flavobacteriales bacterium]|jgi:hypothetical protein
MKILRIALIGFLLVFGVYAVLSIIGPKKLETSRSISINAPLDKVYALTSDFTTWSSWSPWQLKDAQMKNVVSGTPGALGHTMTWESETQGSGTQEIVEVVPSSLVKTSLKFKDWDETSYASFIMTPEGEGTKLTWTMEGGNVPFLLRGMMVIFGAQSSIESDYEQGLANIKKLAEQ